MKNIVRVVTRNRLLSYTLVFFMVLCGFFPHTSPAEERTVSLASLEWPPYVGSQIPGQGLCAVIARAAFAEMGYELQITFFPWARTLRMAKDDAKYIGYFPEYYAEILEQDFVFSEPIGESPLGFVEKRDAPVTWTTLDDLRPFVIGTVRGYVNTADFDRKLAAGELRQEEVNSDMQNLKKVGAGRIPLAVIDRDVMRYLLDTDPNLRAEKALLQFNSRILGQKQLFLCFRKSAEGERLAEIFNAGLKRIDLERIREDYLTNIFSDDNR